MKTLLNQCVDQLNVAIDRFPWEDKRAYADWLAQTYYYVSHTTRLLAASAARFEYTERGNALHHRFATHMAEEKKHELLCIHDMKRVGAAIDDYPEHESTRAFYEPQYYKIEHQSPMALFGYMLPLEAIGPAAGTRMCDRIVAAHGEKSDSFVKVHAHEDLEHLDKALAMLETATPTERRIIEMNLRQTTYAYVAMLQDIRRHLDMPRAT